MPHVSVAQSLPGPASPERIEQRFQAPPVPKAAPQITIPGPETPTLSEDALKIDFTLSALILDGSTVYKPDDVAPLAADLISKKVSLAQVFVLRDTLTAKYRRDGYILSQVIVPPQNVTDGVVHLQAIEGYVGNVSVQGDANDSRGLIIDMGERIMAARPLTAETLERYVLLMQDIPGLTVQTVLRPAKNSPGATDLDLVVSHRTVTGYASIDDRGSKAIGPLQAQLGVNFNSLFGRDDLTALQLATVSPTKELRYASLQHNEILGPDGTRLNLSATCSHSKPAGALIDLDPLGNSQTWRVGIDYPVIRSSARTLRLGTALTALNSSVDLLGTRFSDDKVRYLSFTATYDIADTFFGDTHAASTLITTELSKGLNALGAIRTGSPNLSVANGHSDFTRLNADVTRNQSISGPFGLGLAAAAQVAASPLLSAQRFGLGGSRFGRAYEPSELLGDNGLAASIEARYNLPPSDSVFSNPQIYAFYDIGKVWNRDPALGQPKSQSLASAGPGVRFELPHQFSSNIELAQPLTRDIASRANRRTRLLFSVASRF